MSIDVTLPQLLRRNAERMPERAALREKDLGIWQPYSWRSYWEEVRDFASGLAASGFAPGDKLSVIGENRPRLYFAQLAAQSLGGIAVPVYQDAIATELAYVLDHAVEMAFLGSNTAGDWAVGDFWGPLGNETRALLDHLATGAPTVHTTPEQARVNLETTIAIERAVASGQSVRLPLQMEE